MTPQPTIAGFQNFVYNVMKIPVLALPTNDPTIQWAYDSSLATVNQALIQVSSPQPGGYTVYARAVYNLGGSNLVNWSQDEPGRTFWDDLRTKLGISKFQAGVVSSSGDAGTSVSLLNPDFMREFTLGNLQQIKDPWGRAYLAIAQDYGTLWGLS